MQTNRLALVVVAISGACLAEPEADEEAVDQDDILLEEFLDELPNNAWIPNQNGFAASFGAVEGFVDLSNDFFRAQGTNGRHCGTCHGVENGWGINPSGVNLLFLISAGTHPIFVNNLDTDTPTSDMSTVEARWASTTMLRQGKFTRKVAPPMVRDYDVIAASDPFGVGTTSSLWFFRRPLATSDFRSHGVMWDGANTVGTVLRDGLIKQARGNVTGAQQGQPAPDPVIFAIVDYEMQLTHAQTYVWGLGRTDAGGARGGPEHAAAQPFVEGRFDLFDAWETSSHPRRRQVFRGQELFNNVNPPSGRRCGGCHNAANGGQNVSGTLFDVGASRPEFARADMAIYTFQRISDGAIVETTDPGRGIRNGVFADLGRFKTPTLRGLSSRAPYFHNGIAGSLEAVVDHYEAALGFDFTDAEEADLVAFLEAL
jgi:hypothetical protein